ncbi:aldehyde dehydrogenase [Candidatus Peregrinibacteria bacterium CG10_big_fil_rev_8_21_14_0_10_42_8]|nr:MAG: aldehyde dehydrogenase [Candidatus Peregrinibacteria bacterium CG10_big_fil_rev_8_21_14_0_10_42_8]
MTIQLPALRFGDGYQSLNRNPVVDLGSGEEIATLGLVDGSMIATDCLHGGRLQVALDALQAIPVRKRIAMSVEAANHFESATLDCGGDDQTLDNYIEQLARTSGLSFALAKANTSRICAALRSTEDVLNGLSRGLPLDIYDTGFGTQGGANVRINPRIKALGCCMPNNSPGVHVLWLTPLAFGIPVLIRPGSSEPFTPYRLIQAHIAAGYPKEAFGYYPCDYGAADRIPTLTGGGIVFGSDATVEKWASNPRVNVHGSGYSKLFLGDDVVDDWERLLSEMVKNVAANSGRSCFAVSRICVPRHATQIAAALAEELAKIAPLPLQDPEARLSAMSMPQVATMVDESIREGLEQGDATDVTARYRKGDRLTTFEGRTYLQPTLVTCPGNDHPLAQKEFLFPYSAIVECSTDQAFAEMGPTLSLAVYTNDDQLKMRARRSHARLVSINVPTGKLDRRQPHEEDLFDLLYHRQSYVE